MSALGSPRPKSCRVALGSVLCWGRGSLVLISLWSIWYLGSVLALGSALPAPTTTCLTCGLGSRGCLGEIWPAMVVGAPLYCSLESGRRCEEAISLATAKSFMMMALELGWGKPPASVAALMA